MQSTSSKTSSFRPLPFFTKCVEVFREKYNKGLPKWVLSFDGPLKAFGVNETCTQLLSESMGLLWQRWAKKLLTEGLGTMCVPQIYFEAGKPVMKFVLFLSRPKEALRMGRSHVSKDIELGQVESKHVVNVADVEVWKTQRRHMVDAFLPSGPLSDFVPTLATMADQMVENWHVELLHKKHTQEQDVLDVREWMHHTALGMFVACMMGDDRAFGPELEHPLALDVDLYAEYEDDIQFADTTPKNSLPARSLFNLEGLGLSLSAEEQQARFIKAMGYVGKLVNRGEERQENGQVIGPLMERIIPLKQDEKIANTLATLVAGHDTTAYTMQFVLMELARNPQMQRRVRTECTTILNDIQAKGDVLTYSDLPRFELLTKCIAETLRMWNVAGIVFPRVTSYDDQLIGMDNKTMVDIPKGTKFTFWYYGQHHSKALWGEDVMDWNPDREWHPRELMKSTDKNDSDWNTAQTPCTERFHPFSIPTRDCLGKGFAMTEMRILLPRVICNFNIDMPQNSELVGVKPEVTNDVFANWTRKIGGPAQPHQLRLKITPLNQAKM